MLTIHDIIALIKAHTGSKKVYPDTDINDDLGVYGDDFEELLINYHDQYDVDMDGFLWYFHYEEEANSFPGGLFFKPSNYRVERIPVTPEMLLQFAKSGKWAIDYPEHTLPNVRYDIMINRALLFVMLSVLGVVLWFKWFG